MDKLHTEKKVRKLNLKNDLKFKYTFQLMKRRKSPRAIMLCESF